MPRQTNQPPNMGWLCAIPVAIIAVMLFLSGYHILQKYGTEAIQQPENSAETGGTPEEAASDFGEKVVFSENEEEDTDEGEEDWEEEEQEVININTADELELMRLPGVGEVMAQRIVATREYMGGFRRIEDIMLVEGIGDKTFANMEPYIVVE